MEYYILFISSIIISLLEEYTLEKKLALRTKVIKLCKKEIIYFGFIVIIIAALCYLIDSFHVNKIIQYALYGVPFGTGIFFLKIYRLKE